MYASITTTDPEPNVSARIVDTPSEAEQIVSALTAALQTAVAHMTTAEVAGAR